MRFIEKSESRKSFERTVDGDANLKNWLSLELLDAVAKRYWQEMAWREDIRQYEAIPPPAANRYRPYQENLLLEIPLGATRCDELQSQITDLIENQAPVFTVRGSPGYDKHAYAFQLLANKFFEDRFTNLRNAHEETVADTVQLGTGTYYVVRAEERIRSAGTRIINRGPRVFSIPTEDIIVPGAAYQDPDNLRFISYRQYLNAAEIAERARTLDWDTEGILPATNISWVRQRREEAARTDQPLTAPGDLYEIHQVYCYFNYDDNEDSEPQDLLVTFEPSSQRILKVQYNPYDARPFCVSRYQARPHLFYGLGVMEMARPFEDEITEWHNFLMANAHLSNSRFIVYRQGAQIGDSIKLSVNNPLGLADPQNDIRFDQAGDVYGSGAQYQTITESFADRRIGTNSLGSPTRMGGRTPATTAMSLLQSQNRRFASPFNNIRHALEDAVTQCCMRMAESYKRGGKDRDGVLEYLIKATGMDNAKLIVEVFEEAGSNIRDHLLVEVTANSSSINREADKQSAVMLVNTLGAYYDKLVQGAQLIANPMTPPELKKLILVAADKSGNAMERLLRTFDSIRDPGDFIIREQEVLGSGTAQGPGAGGANPANQGAAPGAPGQSAPPAGAGSGLGQVPGGAGAPELPPSATPGV